jgi:hypothetical protein
MCGGGRVGISGGLPDCTVSRYLHSTVNSRSEIIKMRTHIYSDNEVTPCVPGTVGEVV